MTLLRSVLMPALPSWLGAISTILCYVLFCEISVWAQLPGDLSQGIGVLSQYKSNGEQQARILMHAAAANDIDEHLYRTGRSLYAEAKAAFDGWIDQLVFEIQSSGSFNLSPQYETLQRKAKEKGDDFTKLVRCLCNDRGPMGDELKSIFASMKETGEGIWRGFTQVGTQDRMQVIEQLKTYKWLTFETIKPTP